MNREDLKKYRPHREPMLLVDETEIDQDGVGHSKYLIKDDEFFCRGHFPDNPVVPGVILLEIMAQSCALLVKNDLVGKTTLYSGISNAKFKGVVKPGDLCETTTRLTSKRGHLYFCSAELKVDGKLCSKAELSFALVD